MNAKGAVDWPGVEIHVLAATAGAGVLAVRKQGPSRARSHAYTCMHDIKCTYTVAGMRAHA